MKNRCSRVIGTRVSIFIILIQVLFVTSFIRTFHFTFFCSKNNFLLLPNFLDRSFILVILLYRFDLRRIISILLLALLHFFRLKELLLGHLSLFFLNITMFSFFAAFNLLKFFPRINYYITACPAFFQIMEDWFSNMIST